MKEAAILITDLTVVSGSKQIVINSSENISQFIEGDLIHVPGQIPIVISEINNKVITSKFAPVFSVEHSPAGIIASNVFLRQALSVIKENNAQWALHFSAIVEWASSDEATKDLFDVNGNKRPTATPKEINDLAQRVGDSVVQAEQLALDVTALSETVNNINGVLDNKVSTAQEHAATATTKASNASNEAVAARAAKAETQAILEMVETIFDNYDDRFLGQKSSDPLLDNDGDELLLGACYWSTATTPPSLRFYNGAAWESPSLSAQNSAIAAAGYAAKAQVHEENAKAIAGGDYVPSIRTVAGKPLSNNILLDKYDVGLGRVENTNDAEKEICDAAKLKFNAQEQVNLVNTQRLDEIEIIAQAGLFT